MKPISISEKLMFNTIKLETKNGTGTGFFFNFKIGDSIYPTLITNKHVINYNNEETVNFYLHIKSNDDDITENINIKYQTHWYFHPTKDLCFTFVYPLFQQVKDKFDKEVFYIATDESIVATTNKLIELRALEELVMVGYPIGLFDQRNNYPIFRKGYTASHPAIDFNGDSIGVIDMACFPGSSGSPIYILNENGYWNKDGNFNLGSARVIFLGILFAGPQYDATGNIKVKVIPTSNNILETHTNIMTNLGYYIKSNELFEFKKIIESLIKEN